MEHCALYVSVNHKTLIHKILASKKWWIFVFISHFIYWFSLWIFRGIFAQYSNSFELRALVLCLFAEIILIRNIISILNLIFFLHLNFDEVLIELNFVEHSFWLFNHNKKTKYLVSKLREFCTLWKLLGFLKITLFNS